MSDHESTFQFAALTSDADYIAPDGSAIRLLPAMKGGGLCCCTLPEGMTSLPVEHCHVEEIWYVLAGQGEVWRKSNEMEEIVQVEPGTSLTIPPRTSFQFRNLGTGALIILIVTMPPWPGASEAEKVSGIWPASTFT